MPSFSLTHLFSKRWRILGEKGHLVANADGLRRLLPSMYGDWQNFSNTIFEMYYPQIIEGIVANRVFLKKSVLEKIGLLDERMQSADWDIYLHVKKRAEEIGDLHRVMTVCWAYLHHFIRTTLKSIPEPFACTHPKHSGEEKWDKETVKTLWPFPNEVQERPSFYKEPMNYWGYHWGKIASRRIKTDHENQWIQFWKKLDRA
jgi:hypothetical protein